LVAVELVRGLGETAQTAAERSGALLVELRRGRRIAVGRGFDATTLERLLTILERV
jgi:signal recognition particle GTPase